MKTLVLLLAFVLLLSLVSGTRTSNGYWGHTPCWGRRRRGTCMRRGVWKRGTPLRIRIPSGRDVDLGERDANDVDSDFEIDDE